MIVLTRMHRRVIKQHYHPSRPVVVVITQNLKQSHRSIARERKFAESDLVDGMTTLWMKPSRVGKIKQEGVHASGNVRNEALTCGGYNQSRISTA